MNTHNITRNSESHDPTDCSLNSMHTITSQLNSSTEESPISNKRNSNIRENNHIPNKNSSSPTAIIIHNAPKNINDQKKISIITGQDPNLNKAVEQARNESKLRTSQSPWKKKFTLSLPFASNHSAITSFLTSILPHESEQEAQRELIKNKLRKTSSISTLEEDILFSEEKGYGDVRKKALKKTFELERLKHSFNTIRAFQHKKTNDGYLYERIHSIWNELEGDILIMGGYRGSILRNRKTSQRLWIPIKAGFNLRKVDLRIGPEDEDELATMKEIYPDGVLTHIGPVDVCRHLIKKLKSNPKITLTDFGYDWRLSPDISSQQLCDKLQEIFNSQKIKRGTYIIAHSMGGIIAHKALQEKTHLIRGIIYVGSPSKCPNILGPLKFGDEVLMNKTVLSKEANFFMRSSFVFLPEDGRCFIEKGTMRKINLDFFDPQVWVKLGLSPLVDEDRTLDPLNVSKTSTKEDIENERKMAQTEIRNKPPDPGISTDARDLLRMLSPIPIRNWLSGSCEKESNDSTTAELKNPLKQLNPFSLMNRLSTSLSDVTGFTDGKEVHEEENETLFSTSQEKCLNYLQKTLKRTKIFLSHLQYVPEKEYPPLVMVYSKDLPTVRGAHIESLKDVKLGNYDDFCYGPGDGVVYYKWLLPEDKGFPVVAKVTTNCGHVSLMSDIEAMAKAFISLVDNDKLRK